ncbi:MAG: hypothetical protein Q8832_02645, partial [Candidatus Phytoplasma australasiaticum]|nr:hypothetical protein [Candidatus Phytoplasma australasiaticum]
MDVGKKKVGEGEEGGVGARKTAPSRPGRIIIVINEPRVGDVQRKEVERTQAPRKRKNAPVGSGDQGGEGSESRASKKIATELAPNMLETLKALLASFTPKTRRKELFENFSSTVERKKYRKEPLEDFLVSLQEDVTAVSVSVP